MLGQLLKVVHGGKIMFILIETSTGLGIIAGWGPLPISVVLRSEESLKSETLSLVWTSKYNTSVNKSEEDSYCSDKLILDSIVSMQNQL